MHRLHHRASVPAAARVALAVLTGALALIVTLSIVTAQQTPNFENSFKSGPRSSLVTEEITYTILAVNSGGPAQSVVLSDAVPNAATYISGTCTYRRSGDDAQPCGPLSQLWQEDFAAGDRITTTLTVRPTGHNGLEPLENCAFLQWADDVKEMCFTTTVQPVYNYLPLVARNLPPRPDLRVTSLTVAPDNPVVGQPVTITLEVRNVGELPAGSFWVDFYLDPDPPPTRANQIWKQLGEYGIAWLVSGGLEPGNAVVLTSLSGYAPYNTNWPDEFVQSGEHDLYAFADSWEGANWFGAVQEKNEGLNNRFGPVTVNVAPSLRGATTQTGDLEISNPRRASP